jgi:hypothetical protein
MAKTDINYTKEAFLHPWNLAFLILAMMVSFSVSLFTAVTWPFETILLFITAIELLYLGILPRQERFQLAVRSQRAAEHAKPPSQKELFQVLTKQSQRRYARLRKLSRDIQVNYRKLSYATQGMLDSHVQKINGLLDSYLKLMYQRERYERTAHETAESEVVRSIEDIREDIKDDSPRVRVIKERHLHILEQRLSRFKKGQENLEIIEAQLATIEDVVKYIHEQSLTLSNPEEISFQLDTLLSEVEETQLAVQEVEDVFAKDTDLLSEMDLYDAAKQQESEKTSSRVAE